MLSLAMENSAQYSTLFKDVNGLLSRGHYDAALKQIEGLLQSSSDMWSLLHYAGLCCFGLGHFREAKDFFEKSLKLSPNRHASLVGMASCHIHLGRLADGLFYHKLSLTSEADSAAHLLPAMLDFASNLDLWQEDRSLLNALSEEREGKLLAAHKNFLDYAKTKDPNAEVLRRIILLSLKIGDYTEALNASTAYHRLAPQQGENCLLAAKTLHRLGHKTVMDELLKTCLEDKDSRIQAGALNIITHEKLMSAEQQAELIQNCWKKSTQNALNPEQYQRSQASETSDHYSVGIFLGDLSPHSPALWFFDALHYFDASNVNIIIYLENADYWGRSYLRSYKYETVETELIDTETLACIIARNDHQVLWDLSGFNESFRIDAFSQFSRAHRIGLVEHPAHLKHGYDAILVQDAEPSVAHCHPVSELTFIPAAGGAQWQYREDTEFCITLALLPRQVQELLPLLIEILQLNARIVLSINETLCGEYGIDLLVSGFQKHGVSHLLERIALFQQDNFRDHQNIAEHLLSGDLMLSTGIVGYDYTALQRRVPIALPPNQNHPALERFAQPELIPSLKTWLEDSEQWAEWTMHYQQQCDQASAATEHFDTMQNLMNILFP